MSMKVKALNELTLEYDLAEYPKEVSDYVFDQIEDRLADSLEVMEIVEATEFEINYEKQTIQFSGVIQEMLQKIIEEKEADMAYEAKHEDDNQ